jgi:cytochrome c oxidase subunit IV
VGIFATGLAIAAGVAVALFVPAIWQRHVKFAILVRTLQGLVVFILLAVLTADIAARWQLYPLGIGGAEEKVIYTSCGHDCGFLWGDFSR